MKVIAIVIPLGISLAVAGGLMAYVSLEPAKAAAPPIVSTEVRHPVTEEMLRSASLMAKKPAPFFKLKDVHGIDVQLGGSGKKPQFVYFILDGCPCSINAQPLFNRMYRKFKDKVDFIGVINTGPAKAKDYAGENTVIGPLVCDESLKIIKAYRARESVYNALVLPDGIVQKMWPGYSQATLHELNDALSKLTGTPQTSFDAAFAPEKMASGCYFY